MVDDAAQVKDDDAVATDAEAVSDRLARLEAEVERRLAWEETVRNRLADFEGALLRLASLDFDVTPRITGEGDMLDAVAAGIIMLGEELRASTVSKDYLDGVFDTMLDMLLVLRSDGTIVQANRAVTEVLEYEPDELAGRRAEDLFATSTNLVTARAIAPLLNTSGTSEADATMVAKDGREVPTLVSLSVMTGDDRVVDSDRVVVVARDVTERGQAQRALEQANADLEKTVRELRRRTEELDLIGEMGEVLQSCHRVEELFRVVETFLKRIFPKSTGAVYLISASGIVVEARATWNGFPDHMAARVFGPGDCWALRRGRAHATRTDDGGIRCDHVPENVRGPYLCIPMLTGSEAIGILHLRRPATEDDFGEAETRIAHTVAEHIGLALTNITLRESLRSQSIRDPLTGLFNRRYLEETLERELHRASRAEQPLGFISIDIDRFKNFNDTFGHEAGDVVLKEVASILADNTRGGDIACRPGGEEFALVLVDASAEDAHRRAEEIRHKIKSLTVTYRKEVLADITVSCGVAAFPAHGDTMQEIMLAADAALYQAKASGRDRSVTASVDAAP